MTAVEEGYIGIRGISEQSIPDDDHFVSFSTLGKQSLKPPAVSTLIGIVDVIADNKPQTGDVADMILVGLEKRDATRIVFHMHLPRDAGRPLAGLEL